MMKVLPWFALLFACTAVPADAHLTLTGTPKIDLFSSARLIDTNQSQSLEAVSTADGNLRLPSYKLAGVYFITGNNGQTFDNEAKDNDFTDPTGDNCKRLGFAVTSCASGLFNRACPYNDRIYDKCCEASYTYEASNCPAPRKLSSETCGGKHRCYCDTAQYPFASCSDPQIKGNACTDDGGTRYATCVCPNPVSTPYGCETYYAAPCGSVCKKAYADNCRNRTAVQTPYGCEKYFADCSSKCEKAYSDNCRNRNAVITSCPANATCAYFGDCKSKVQSWACNSGYVKSGNSCVTAYKSRTCQNVGDILYEDGSCAISASELEPKLTPIGVVFDTEKRLAVALTEVTIYGTPGRELMQWSEKECDIPDLPNCDGSYNRTCGTDGRANTNAALATDGGCSGRTYAVNAVNLYEPNGCSSAFCRKGKWFLPSFPELMNLCDQKASVETAMKNLKSFGAESLVAVMERYWSSTENIYLSDSGDPVEISYLYLTSCGGGGISKIGKTNYTRALVRPIVRY
ncbi:MAG: hypothetical protein ACLSWJ_05285 [Alphaproteobacteria bacterium]